MYHVVVRLCLVNIFVIIIKIWYNNTKSLQCGNAVVWKSRNVERWNSGHDLCERYGQDVPTHTVPLSLLLLASKKQANPAATTYWSESQMCFNVKFSYIKQKWKIREFFFPPHTIGYTLYRYVCVDTENEFIPEATFTSLTAEPFVIFFSPSRLFIFSTWVSVFELSIWLNSLPTPPLALPLYCP